MVRSFGASVVGRRPQGCDELRTVDRAPLAQHEVLQQLELLEGESSDTAVELDALAREVDDDAGAAGRRGRLLLGVAVLRERGRVLERESYDIDIPTACADWREGDGGVGLGRGNEFGGEALERVDHLAEVRAGIGGLELVEADVQHESAGLGAGGHRTEAARFVDVFSRCDRRWMGGCGKKGCDGHYECGPYRNVWVKGPR